MKWWTLGQTIRQYASEFSPQDLICPYCSTEGRFTEIFGEEVGTQRNRHDGMHSDVWKCDVCANFTFVIWRSFETGQMMSHTQAVDWQAEPSPRGEPQPPKEWPEQAQTAMREASNAIAGRNWNSAGAMARRAVQAGVRAKGGKAKKGDALAGEIDSLKAQGLLTADLAAWAHEVRALGNLGAHPDGDIEELPEQDAREAVNFANYFLTYVFTLPHQIEQSKQRRTDKK